jgi:uncharacterized phage-associated protein
MKPLELAYYIINNFSNFEFNKNGITHLKLQKLLYYTKAWSTVAKVDVGDLQFFAWKHGPVNSEIYDQFKDYGKDIIPPSIFNVSIEKDKKTFIDFVIKNYIFFDAFTLSSMTHKEDPWIQTVSNEIISEELMKEYYSKQSFAKNFPLEEGKKFYPIKTDLDFSFKIDMESPEELPDLTYASIEDYLEKIQSNQNKLQSSLTNMLNAD